MTVALCVCDAGGMMFNKRRQSKDRRVIADLVALSGEREIVITPFSEKLFSECADKTRVLSDLSAPCAGSFVFCDDVAPSELAFEISTLIIYRWNRKYPADKYMGICPERDGFSLVESVDFVGDSHEKITREIWKKT